MRLYRRYDILKGENGDITISHRNGAFHFNENDIANKERVNDFFCKFKIEEQEKFMQYVFYISVVTITLGLVFILIGLDWTKLSISEKSYLVLWRWTLRLIIIYTIPVGILTYFSFRFLYYIFYRDFFSKDLLQITLKSNSYIIIPVNSLKIGFDTPSFNLAYEKLKKLNSNCYEKDYDGSERIFGVNLLHCSLVIILFITCSYIVYSNWGKNSFIDPCPNYPAELNELSDKDSSQLNEFQIITSKKLLEENRKERENIFLKRQDWSNKYANEQISPFFFFSLGFILLPLIGIMLLVVVVWLFWPWLLISFMLGIFLKKDIFKNSGPQLILLFCSPFIVVFLEKWLNSFLGIIQFPYTLGIGIVIFLIAIIGSTWEKIKSN